jgi:hypothetical protein
MSSPDHLDLDALADVLADGPAPGHLAGCADCTAALDGLRQASARVTGELAELPPVPLPADVAARLQTVESRPVASSVTTLPAPRPAGRSTRRWVPAAAAVVLLLGGAAYGVSRLSGGSSGSSTSAAAGSKAAAGPATGAELARNDSGADYTGRADLAAAVPALLAGTAKPAAAAPLTGAQTRAAADPLARLRDNAGLADCLLALLPPEDPSVRPLALDYARYKGAPALVVVLPSAVPTKLDVFVVGPGCSRANDSTLFYTSVDKP